MGTQLQQILRSLCFKTVWKYAIFWKLKHRARMILSWEDAYYDNHEPPDPSEDTCLSDTSKNLCDGRHLQDPLGLAVAKMSYLVYSLGEGIIGQVAVTGKHRWIFADNPASSSWSSSEYCDGWLSQFSAGIRTVAVVAVVPHGVVQLGSLNSVIEDLTLVTHIKDLFCSLGNSSTEFLPNSVQCTTIRSTLCLSEVSTRTSGLETFHDCEDRLAKSLSNKRPVIRSHFFPSLGRHNDFSQYILPLPVLHQRKAVEVVNKHVGVESPTSKDDENDELFHPRFEIFNLEHQKEVQMKLHSDQKFGEETSSWRDAGMGSKYNDTPASHNLLTEKTNLYNVTLPAEKSVVDFAYLPSDHLHTAARDKVKFDRVSYLRKGVLNLDEPIQMQLGKGSEQNLEFQTGVSHMDTVNSLKFFAGCELQEALGPAFRREQTSCAWSEAERTGTETIVESPEGLVSSQFKSECGSEHLLEAVIANACRDTSNANSENSFCKSGQSLLTTEKMTETPSYIKHASSSAGGLIDQSSPMEEDTHHCLSSTGGSTELCAMRSPKELSTTTLSTCSEQLERRVEPAKINKKRARPGENCRPRPRDRQLIQDRVKELREIVPNGSKCSIDSLLERTIKHMLFLQSTTKHADKLKKCAESKSRKEMGLLGSCSHEHGSSWALELGGQEKFCPIIVENLNLSGQMLVEMLCEECSHFLEIAEAIRGLGLMILKGATEVRGEKTWACFVVEGQNNRVMHRMDVLWSLVQLLQPKTTI